MITILLDRLNKTEGQLRDPEAETLIRETTTGRPDTPYSLVQTVLIQDLSLYNAQSRITDLEAQLTEPLGGPGTGPPLAATPQPGYASEERSAARPAPGAGLIGDGGFLRSAATTAAGIAGGALLFEGIQSMFGHHDAAGITGNHVVIPGLGETVLNNHYGAETGAADEGSTEEHAAAGYDPDPPGLGPAADSGQGSNGSNAS